MRREFPQVAEHLRDLPADVIAEARELFGKCFVTSSWDGERAHGHTPDEAVALRLKEGWEIPLPEPAIDGSESVRLICGGQGTHSRGERVYYEFGIPTALTFLVREIIDAKAAA